MKILFFVFLAYLLGSVPTSYWLGLLFFKTDLRKQGSGNAGATNFARCFGGKYFLPLFLLDAAKGWLPVFLALNAGISNNLAVLVGAAAIVGHIWTIFLNFKGGKGVATAAGVFVALSPFSILIALGIFLVVFFISGYVSLGSVVAAISLPILLVGELYFQVLDQPGWSLVSVALLIAIFIVYSHRSNLRRLLKGEEDKVRFRS